MQLKRLSLILLPLILSGCVFSFGGTKIKDYTDRSIAYGWIDVSEIDGNHLYDVQIKQYRPATKEPYYSSGIEKYEGGYVFYHYGLPNNGAFKLDNLKLQSCLGFICGNTIHQYNFGAQGSSASVKTGSTSRVHYLGSYKLKEVKTGWLEQDKFSIKEVKGPSRKGMLEIMLDQDIADDHPVVAERIRKAMK